MIEKIEVIRSLVGGAITQKYNGEIIYHDDQTPPTNEEIQQSALVNYAPHLVCKR